MMALVEEGLEAGSGFGGEGGLGEAYGVEAQGLGFVSDEGFGVGLGAWECVPWIAAAPRGASQ